MDTNDIKTLMDAPALLTEAQVTRLRAMVLNAKRILDKQADEQRYLYHLQQPIEVEAVFKTADGLTAYSPSEPFSVRNGHIPKLQRRAVYPLNPLPETRDGREPLVQEIEPQVVREYEWSGWILGRVPVYREIVKG